VSKRAIVLLLVIPVLLSAACDTDKAQEEAKATAACPSASVALPQAPQLPAGFPSPSGLTYTGSSKAGPSTIVHGYFAGELNDLYDRYKSGFTAARYDLTKTENDGPDAEVDWSGGNTTGEVKLVAACKGRTGVTLTIRPGS
jgi:hypothetical protein